MKNKMNKKSVKQNHKSKLWIWVLGAFAFGAVCGCATYYLISNWNGFFVMCPDGNKPDKNGCCSGEVYTDAGDGWMVCCPDGAENCFPPMK